jgi:hypothetical protein
MPTDRERWTLTFEPVPDPQAPPAPIRIRHLLKRALRSFGLRCVNVAPGGALDAEPARGPAGKEVASQRPAGATEEPRP